MILKRLSFGLLWIALPLVGKAQLSNLSQFSDILTSRSHINPAFVTPYDFTVGIPVLSRVNVHLDNNFLSWNSAVTRGLDDSLRLDPMRLLGKAGSNARIAVNADVDILRFTWRRKLNNFEIGLSAHADAQVVLSKNTLSFLVKGNGAYIGDNYLTGNKVDANSYASLYFGYSRIINKNLTIGGRVKFIQGLWSFYTNDLGIQFNVQNSDMTNPDMTPYQYGMRVDGEVLTNLPITNDLGMGRLTFSPFRNIGAALDLGVNYSFGKKKEWNFSASALNLGFIVWNDDNSGPFRSNHEDDDFQYEGMGTDLIRDVEDLFTELKDLAVDTWDTLGFVRNDTLAFTRALPASFNLALSYTLDEIHTFGAVFKGQVYNSYFSPELSVSYTCRPVRCFAISVGNTFTSGNLLNFGAAFVVNAGPVQIYLGVDRINSFNVSKMRTACVNFGLNLVFGQGKYDWYTGQNNDW